MDINDIKLELERIRPLIFNAKRSLSSEEVSEIYRIYNEISSEDKTPNGCNSCIRNVINALQRYSNLYLIMKKN